MTIPKLSTKAFETVKAVRELLSDETKWTTEYYARDAEGGYTHSTSPNAACWCLEGAFNKVTNNHDAGIPSMVLREIEAKCFPDDTMVGFNDKHDFPTVAKRLDDIIRENSK